MELVLIEPDSPEWNFMWNWLSEHHLNKDLEVPSVAKDEETGEEWQYMGSYKSGERVISEFRHRAHPKTKEVESLKVSHIQFDESCIKKKFKL